jgi:hypothetical protein
MITADEFKEKFIDEDGEVSLPRSCYLQEEGTIDHELIVCVEIWKYNEQFFAVTYTQDDTYDNSYGEVYPLTVVEVVPKEKTIIVYIAKDKK